jgi:hypothetical protein
MGSSRLWHDDLFANPRSGWTPIFVGQGIEDCAVLAMLVALHSDTGERERDANGQELPWTRLPRLWSDQY